MLATCNKMIDFNFSDITHIDALIMILRGLHEMLKELKITESIRITETYTDNALLYNMTTTPTLSYLVVVSILYGRYNTYFKPQVNEFIEKVINEYCNH